MKDSLKVKSKISWQGSIFSKFKASGKISKMVINLATEFFSFGYFATNLNKLVLNIIVDKLMPSL